MFAASLVRTIKIATPQFSTLWQFIFQLIQNAFWIGFKDFCCLLLLFETHSKYTHLEKPAFNISHLEYSQIARRHVTLADDTWPFIGCVITIDWATLYHQHNNLPSNITSLCSSIWTSGSPEWHLWCVINTSFLLLSVRAPSHFVLQYILFSLNVPRSPPLQPTCQSAEKDEACHLLVCAEGEMTFERCAKCECTLRSCLPVRSDHCYCSCPCKDGFPWLPPFAALRVVKVEPCIWPGSANLIRGAVIAGCVGASTIV